MLTIKNRFIVSTVGKIAIFLVVLLILNSGCNKIDCTKENYCETNKCILTNSEQKIGICKEINQNDWVLCPTPVGDVCITLYDPVCGSNQQTYSNSCAACKIVNSYQRGECNGR